MVNTSSVRDVSGYIRDRALTLLLPKEDHRAFDDHWKRWAAEALKTSPDHKVSVAEWEMALVDAAESVPALKGRTAGTMALMIRHELYETLGLLPTQRIRLPGSKK